MGAFYLFLFLCLYRKILALLFYGKSQLHQLAQLIGQMAAHLRGNPHQDQPETVPV